jgi:cytochrome c biogenesis protein
VTVQDEATRLSTQPEAPTRRPGQRLAATRNLWRQLTSMRVALVLLFLLALASVPGGFIPQRSINPILVDKYRTEHPDLYPILDKLSLFDVFRSPWFSAIYLLLFVSLVGCLFPRIRLHARALRTAPPKLPARLDRLPVSATWETELPPDEALARVKERLRGWRTVTRENGVSAEKGYLRETGNLVFHVSLVVLLVGIAVGNLFGFKGTVLVKEGSGFANTVLAYDDVRPGRWFSDDQFVPFHFDLKAFNATYAEDGKALTFDAEIDWAPDADAPLRPYDVRVNHPLKVDGAKLYLLGHGYAPHVIVKDPAGKVAFDDTVVCLPQNPQFVSTCVIKVSGAQGTDGRLAPLAFQGIFTPTTVQNPNTGQVTSSFPDALNPALTIAGFSGDFGAESGVSQSVYELNTDPLTPIAGGEVQGLFTGQTWNLPNGGSIQFVGTEEWATFQVTQDPGKLIALIAAVGIVGGLLLSLRVRRRRVWVKAVPAGGADGPTRTVVQVGGLARTDADAFAAEFEALTARLREAVPEEERAWGA